MSASIVGANVACVGSCVGFDVHGAGVRLSSCRTIVSSCRNVARQTIRSKPAVSRTAPTAKQAVHFNATLQRPLGAWHRVACGGDRHMQQLPGRCRLAPPQSHRYRSTPRRSKIYYWAIERAQSVMTPNAENAPLLRVMDSLRQQCSHLDLKTCTLAPAARPLPAALSPAFLLRGQLQRRYRRTGSSSSLPPNMRVQRLSGVLSGVDRLRAGTCDSNSTWTSPLPPRGLPGLFRFSVPISCGRCEHPARRAGLQQTCPGVPTACPGLHLQLLALKCKPWQALARGFITMVVTPNDFLLLQGVTTTHDCS